MASLEVLTPGSVFAGRFRIIELLAEGETGAAYLVDELPKGTRCVLRVMTAALVKQGALRKAFAGYAKSTSKVASASLLQTLDAGIDRESGRPWFTTDRLRGEDLATRIARKGPLPPPEVRILLAALCDALGKAHAQALVHYDLTPENIHLEAGRPFAVKLRELTISRLVWDALAAQGELIGTAIWMPPEQFDLGRRLAPPANIWSLALLAFHAATGRSYWVSASDTPLPSKDLLREILAGPIVSASERARALGHSSGLPIWFDAWFARCVVRAPDKRLPDGDAARALLADIAAPHASAAPAEDVDDQRTTTRLPDRPPRPKGSRSLPLGIVAEAQGRAVGPPPLPAAAAPVDGGRTRRQGRIRWHHVLVPCIAAALLVALWRWSGHHQLRSGAASAGRSETSESQLPVPSAAFTRSESFAAGIVPATSALEPAPPDAAPSSAAVAERTFAAGDARGAAADYDLAAALKVLNGVYYGACAVHSAGKLAITFAPSGRVKKVVVVRGDYDDATTACINARFGAARMSPFRGGEQSVTADIVATR
jgi:hypothetical protein